MSYEYLVVKFPQQRPVLLNGEPMGETNVKLELEGGSYEVTLGPPPDFKPEKHQIDLRHTAASRPLRIEFEVI